jgi:hypothetical protein
LLLAGVLKPRRQGSGGDLAAVGAVDDASVTPGDGTYGSDGQKQGWRRWEQRPPRKDPHFTPPDC